MFVAEVNSGTPRRGPQKITATLTFIDQVKSIEALLYLRAALWRGVIIGESNYALDDDGNRILIGLTVEETREFLELTDLLASISPGQPLSSIDWTSPKEMRWLALMQKHSLELEKHLRPGGTKHWQHDAATGRFNAFMTPIRAIIVGPPLDTSISTSIAVCHSGRSDSFFGRLVM
jgi:hypothetical protein